MDIRKCRNSVRVQLGLSKGDEVGVGNYVM